MKIYGMTAGISFLGLLASAAIVTAQVNVTTPPPGTVGPTNVQAGPVNVQTVPGGGTSVNLAPGAPAAAANQIPNNAAVRQENRIERREDRQMNRAAVNNNWRMLNHNNQWWYWNPNNSWSVYRNNQWVPYTAGNQSTFVPNTAVTQPGGQYYYSRRGPLGLRRQVTGYRGPITQPVPVPANQAMMNGNSTTRMNSPALNNSIPNNPGLNNPAPNNNLPANNTVPANPTTDRGAARPEGGTNGQPNDPLINGVK